jgi:hypothetical protein
MTEYIAPYPYQKHNQPRAEPIELQHTLLCIQNLLYFVIQATPG